MRIILCAVVAFFFLASCATDQSGSQTAALEAELRAEQERAQHMQEELARSEAELAESHAQAANYGAQVAELEFAIQQATENQADPEELARMQSELDTALADEQDARKQSETYAAQAGGLMNDIGVLTNDNNVMSEKLANLLLTFSSDSGDPEIVAQDVQATEVDSDEPILKTVFYATNRVRLERHWYAFLKPFIPPFVVLLIGAILVWLTSRYIKTEYQKRTIVGIAIASGGMFVWLVLAAIQNVTLTAQSDNTLTVQYGNEIRRAKSGEPPYERGSVKVSIPPRRDPGEVPQPQLIKFEFVVDTTKHFQLAAINPSTRDSFYADIEDALTNDPDKSAFVFVHGFHNTFQDAAFRTAQIAHDMDFPGAPLFFSWPAQGAVLHYLTDAKNVETSALHLRLFLEELHAESGATRIHLIAHSMGSRALAQAVEDMERTIGNDNKFGQLVFAAPDIAKDLLEQKIAALDRVVAGVTLYASAHDSALRLSRALQGDDEQYYQRAGETYPTPMVTPPMQTVDVSKATSGHSYVSDNLVMMRDLSGLLSGSRILTDQSDNYVPTGEDRGYWILLNKE